MVVKSIFGMYILSPKKVFVQKSPGMNPEDRDVETPMVVFEPLLDVTALVGVVHENIGFGELVSRHLRHRGIALEERANITGQVGTDLRGVAGGVGQRDQLGRRPRRAQHRAMVLREIDIEAKGTQL